MTHMKTPPPVGSWEGMGRMNGFASRKGMKLGRILKIDDFGNSVASCKRQFVHMYVFFIHNSVHDYAYTSMKSEEIFLVFVVTYVCICVYVYMVMYHVSIVTHHTYIVPQSSW